MYCVGSQEVRFQLREEARHAAARENLVVMVDIKVDCPTDSVLSKIAGVLAPKLAGNALVLSDNPAVATYFEAYTGAPALRVHSYGCLLTNSNEMQRSSSSLGLVLV